MKIRKNIIPRRLSDILCFALIGVSLPIIFIFEMIIVLPAVHEDKGGLPHTFTFVLAMFIMFNIKGNMIMCLMIDTSVDYNSIKPVSNAEANGWQMCKICNKLAPPRSWHCKVCRACILKRDHHCLFIGSCVGHTNHRYFYMFVLYLFIGAMYAFLYNSYYLWVLKAHIYRNLFSLLKMVCPALMIVDGFHWFNIYLIFYNLNILAVVFTAAMLFFHTPMILQGGVGYERDKHFYPYNAGYRKNLEITFGKRSHLVWLSPYLKSELLHNGVDWKKTETIEIVENSKKIL